MFMIMMWTVGMLALAAAAAEAQDGFRSASLPESTLHSTVDDEHDLFRVPADFYNRPPEPGPSRLFFPQWLPTVVPSGWYFDQHRHIQVPFDGHRRVRRTAAETASAVTPLPVAPLVAPPVAPLAFPGTPKTFYVIPGCYAGDRPPESDWLPAGCDMATLRVVPPQ